MTRLVVSWLVLVVLSLAAAEWSAACQHERRYWTTTALRGIFAAVAVILAVK